MLLNCGVGEDSWESLDCKEIQPVHPKGNQSWVFIGRTDAEAETPKLWPPHAKSWLTGKDPDAGRDWGQEEKGATEDEMVGWWQMAGWHHQLDGLQRVGHDWVTEVNWGNTRMQQQEGTCYHRSFCREMFDCQILFVLFFLTRLLSSCLMIASL